MTLERIALWASILTAIGGAIVFILNRWDRRAKKKEEARIWAQRIDQEILSLQKRNEELADDLEDVRKDFAHFVQQLLFKTK